GQVADLEHPLTTLRGWAARRRLPRSYRSPQYRQLVRRRDYFNRASLKRTHLHHVSQISLQQLNVDKPRVGARHIKPARTLEVNRRSCSRRQRSMPQLGECNAFCITTIGPLEYFLRFHVQEAKSHRTVTHDSFEVPNSTASTKIPLWIKSHDGVPPFPRRAGLRVPAIANSASEKP